MAVPSGRAMLALIGAWALGGCGGAPARPDPNVAFARIQVQEATIAHRASEADACAGTAPCPAADEVCEAAEAICAIAGELDDDDARARCALARRRCPREDG